MNRKLFMRCGKSRTLTIQDSLSPGGDSLLHHCFSLVAPVIPSSKSGLVFLIAGPFGKVHRPRDLSQTLSQCFGGRIVAAEYRPGPMAAQRFPQVVHTLSPPQPTLEIAVQAL